MRRGPLIPSPTAHPASKQEGFHAETAETAEGRRGAEGVMLIRSVYVLVFRVFKCAFSASSELAAHPMEEVEYSYSSTSLQSFFYRVMDLVSYEDSIFA